MIDVASLKEAFLSIHALNKLGDVNKIKRNVGNIHVYDNLKRKKTVVECIETKEFMMQKIIMKAQ